MDIVEQLRKSAITASEASKWLAAEKSARNRAAEGSNATYRGAEPHQTLEWRAGQEIERLRHALQEIERGDSAFTPQAIAHAALNDL